MNFFSQKKNNSFIIIILLNYFFDLLILIGFYFGTSQIVDRFYFLKEEISDISTEVDNMSRFDIARFGLLRI